MKIKTIVWLTVFSIAMGYLESAVVIYLRKIYYPGGFKFPLVPMESDIIWVELFREAATLIMLLGVGVLSAQKASLRFASFLYCFAVWDLFYYLFLWVFLGWPGSLFTWDILFLIPVPWVGPVITPCIISMTMIILSLSVFHFQRQGWDTRLRANEWGLFGTGSVVIVLSFIWDYWQYVRDLKLSERSNTFSGSQNMFHEIKDYVPVDFNWFLFLTGEFILIYATMAFIHRIKNNSTSWKSEVQVNQYLQHQSPHPRQSSDL